VEDPKEYQHFFRITREEFDFLLNRVQRILQKQDTVMREALLSALKLEITVRYLAAGDSVGSLAFLFRVPKSTI
jgi:hypothetical protein